MSENNFEVGTPLQRLDFILNELAKRFPDAHNPIMSDPPELKYLATIDTLQSRAQGEADNKTALYWHMEEVAKANGYDSLTDLIDYARKYPKSRNIPTLKQPVAAVTDEFAAKVAKAFQDSQHQFNHPRLGVKTMNWDDCGPEWHADSTRRMKAALEAASAEPSIPVSEVREMLVDAINENYDAREWENAGQIADRIMADYEGRLLAAAKGEGNE